MAIRDEELEIDNTLDAQMKGLAFSGKEHTLNVPKSSAPDLPYYQGEPETPLEIGDTEFTESDTTFFDPSQEFTSAQTVSKRTPLVFPISKMKSIHGPKVEEPIIEWAIGETHQAAWEAIRAVPGGFKRGTYDIALDLPTFHGGISMFGDWVGDNWDQFLQYSENRKKIVFDLEMPYPLEPVKGLFERYSPHSAIAEIRYGTEYKKRAGDNFINALEEDLRIKDRDRGWFDRLAYKFGGYTGELAALPLGGQAFKRAKNTAELIRLAKARMPKERVVKEFYDKIVKGEVNVATGLPFKLIDITDNQVKILVKKALTMDDRHLTSALLRFRDNAFTTMRAGRHHMGDAINYAMGGALFATGSYHGAKAMGLKEETAESIGLVTGLIGMFLGHRPFTKMAMAPAKWTKQALKGTVGRIPIAKRLAEDAVDLDDKYYRVADLTQDTLKFHNLLLHDFHKNRGNAVMANFNILRYAGATRAEAKSLAGAENAQDEVTKFLSKSINKQSMDDATTFIQTLQNMAQKHPEYYEYITKGRERVIALQKQFQDVFIDPSSPQAIKVQNVFKKELREINADTGRYTPTEINDIVDKFEVTDIGLVLDQVFMIDFLSGVRNMAMSEAKLKSMSTKEAIDLYTEAFKYNQATAAQVDLIEAAMKSLMTMDKTEATSAFLNNINKTYKNFKGDIDNAERHLVDLMERAKLKADKLNDNQYRNDIRIITQHDKFSRYGKRSDDMEDEWFEGIHDSINVSKASTMSDFAYRYGKYDEISADAIPVLDNLDEELVENSIKFTIGTTGASTTQRQLSKLDSFKIQIRTEGIKGKYDTQNLKSGVTERGDGWLEEYAASIDNEIMGFHNQLDEVDANFLVNNGTTRYDSQSNKSPIRQVFKDKQDIIDSGQNFNDVLIKAIQKQTEEAASLVSTKATDIKAVDGVINRFTEPRMTVKNARSISQDLFDRARNTKKSGPKRALNSAGYRVLDGLADIDIDTKAFHSDEDLLTGLKNLSESYRKDVKEIYDRGAGSVAMSFKDRVQSAMPPRFKHLYANFLEQVDTKISAEQFNKIFPDEAAAREIASKRMTVNEDGTNRLLNDVEKNAFIHEAAEARKNATDGLRYVLGERIRMGGSLDELAGGNFESWANRFGDIIGDKNIKTLTKYYKHQVKGKQLVTAENQKNFDAFNKEFAKLSKATQDSLKSSVIAQYATKFGEGPSILTPEDILKLITGGGVTHRIGREAETAVSSADRHVRKSAEKLLSRDTATDKLTTPSPEMLRKNVEATQLPIYRRHDELPWGKGKLDGHVIAQLVAENPALKEPLQNIAMDYLLQKAFVTGPKRTLHPNAQTITLEKQMDITAFGDVLKANREALSHIFTKEHMRNLNLLFENSIISAGKNEMSRIMNMATEPTTQSRASRLFALQRKVVGMPYLATEQMVMSFQREKAAFLKRIVLDADFADLMQTATLSPKVSKNTVARVAQAIRAIYGEESLERDDMPYIGALLEDEGQLNSGVFNVDKFLKEKGVSSNQVKGLGEAMVDKLRELGVKYTNLGILYAALPTHYTESEYYEGVVIENLTPTELEVIKKKAKKSRALGQLKAEEEERQRIKRNLAMPTPSKTKTGKHPLRRQPSPSHDKQTIMRYF